MNKKFPVLITILSMVWTFSFVFFQGETAFAQIADGQYEINYEMKEANSENTSIADGYFSKPATLTVENGVQYIQITLTGSNYIESLTAPSGPVEVLSDDTTNHTRVVKFRVDGDLSKPLEMEMHIIVPDLYDMTHTARAVFNVGDLPQANENNVSSENQSKEEDQADETTEADESASETGNDQNDENDEASEEETEESNEVEESEEADEVEENESLEEENATSNNEENDSSSEENDEEQVENEEDESRSFGWLWITLVVLAFIIIGFLFWKNRSKKEK